MDHTPKLTWTPCTKRVHELNSQLFFLDRILFYLQLKNCKSDTTNISKIIKKIEMKSETLVCENLENAAQLLKFLDKKVALKEVIEQFEGKNEGDGTNILIVKV